MSPKKVKRGPMEPVREALANDPTEEGDGPTGLLYCKIQDKYRIVHIFS